MKRDYLKSPLKVARTTRLMAKAVDLFIVLILSVFFYPWGILLSIVYIFISDAIQNGQSVGKRFFGLKVISLEDGTPCSVKQSIIRNLPIIIPLTLAIIPIWGWILAFLLGCPLFLLEIYLLYKIDSGHRLGDVMADTSVVTPNIEQASFKKRKSSWFEEERAPS